MTIISYLLIPFLLLPLFAIVGIPILFITLAVIQDSEVFREVPKFYKEAGFKGEITSIISEQQGLSTKYPYTYSEKINGSSQFFSFINYGGWDKEITGKDFDSPQELAKDYDHELVFPFVEFAFSNSQDFKKLVQTIKEKFSKLDIAVSSVSLSVPHTYDENRLPTEELTKDLQKAEEENRTELRGLTNLSLTKYSQLSDFSYTIILSEKVDYETLAERLEPLDVSGFLVGNYSLVYENLEGRTETILEFGISEAES